MIKEFLEYKNKNIERELDSILLTKKQKQNIYNRYIEFIHIKYHEMSQYL